jgi:hypothetical protein
MEGDIDIISPVDKTQGTGTTVLLSFPCYHDDSDAEIERHEPDTRAKHTD